MTTTTKKDRHFWECLEIWNLLRCLRNSVWPDSYYKSHRSPCNLLLRQWKGFYKNQARDPGIVPALNMVLKNACRIFFFLLTIMTIFSSLCFPQKHKQKELDTISNWQVLHRNLKIKDKKMHLLVSFIICDHLAFWIQLPGMPHISTNIPFFVVVAVIYCSQTCYTGRIWTLPHRVFNIFQNI